jgi:hypothetical protein
VKQEGRAEIVVKEAIEGEKRFGFFLHQTKQTRRKYLFQQRAAVIPFILGVFFCFLQRDFI